jgi:hypothetical protein
MNMGKTNMKRIAAVMLLMAASGFAIGDDTQAVVPVPKHLELARELVATVKPENNKYRFIGPEGVRWKGDLFTSENTVNTMCTGFVGAMLDRAKNPTIKEIESKTYWKKYVRLDSYWEALQKGYGLQKVATLNEVKPGDLFMFFCTTGCNTSEGPALGHITIVDEAPKQKEPSAPLIDNTLQWVVTIIDSADGPHGKNDTRWRPQGEPKVNGVGRGSYRVYTDLQGVPVGYTNGVNAPKFLNITERPIGVGRPLPN